MSDQLPPPRILAVVVTHNGERWLDACLRSLAAQTYRRIDVLVVDSGSTVPAEAQVREALPAAESVRLEANVGFGTAANRGLEMSRQAPEADFFLFLHDDVALEPGCVAQLVEGALETGAGIVGGKGLAWERPEVLLEVGMSADAFCYPFSGLEEEEIDQGQHDMRRDVLFVTSACMLVSRTVLAKCGSWDGDYFLFAEDLDLCIRARLTGFKVIVQPGARFRHVQALDRSRRGGLTPTDVRFLTRRNRSRTIVKNASLPRLVPLLCLFTTLAFLEMVLLAVMRRFDEVPAYPRAFGSFLVTMPDLLRARSAVQKRRTESDRRLRRLMIHYIPRARILLERQLREWERGTLRFGTRTISKLTPSAVAARFSAFIRQPATVTVLFALVILVLAARRTLLGGPVAAGGLWPFPDPVWRLLADYFAPWRDVALGTAAAPPVAFPLLGVFGVLGLGNPRTAQVLLELGLLTAGLAGMSVLLGRRTRDVPARVLAIVFFALAPPVRQAVETGDLGALALYAGLPWLMDIVLRLLGPTPADRQERPPLPLTPTGTVPSVVRAALISAGVVALAPSAWPLLLLAWALFGLLSIGGGAPPGEGGPRLGRALVSLALVPVLLLPWSLEAFRLNGPVLAPLLGGRGPAGAFGPLWAGYTFSEGLFVGPGIGWLVRPAALAATLGALILSTPARRREARVLVSVWLVFAALGGLAGAGWIPAPAATPAMWSMVPLAVVAILSSHLLAGLRHELPHHAIGWRHVATPVLVAVTVAGALATMGRAVGGWKRPRATSAADVPGRGNSLASFFASTSGDVGTFRVLWIGRSWTEPVLAGAGRRSGASFLLTGPRGLTMREAFLPTPAEGDRRLESVVGTMRDGAIHLSGHLLGPAGIRYIVADRTDPVALAAANRQRDFVLDQQIESAVVFRNLQWVPRASAATPELAAAAGGAADLDSQMQAQWAPGPPLGQRSQARFEGPVPPGSPSILVGDNANKGWMATASGRELDRAEAFGWANRFATGGAKGTATVWYGGKWLRLTGVLVQAMLLAMAISMARRGVRVAPQEAAEEEPGGPE
jgi:GT2 family glycosyltransferase